MANQRHPNVSPLTILANALLISALTFGLFRRKRDRPTRADALNELFDAIAVIFAAAANIKEEWRAQWESRTTDELPQRFELVDERTRAAARDVRFARALLQRNRWRSVVEPVFNDSDEKGWIEFAQAVAPTATSLLSIRDAHRARLHEDELDWLDGAIEQFADAWRQLLQADSANLPLARRAAEGVYLHVYLSIQFSDRFIERVRMEAAEKSR